MRGKGWRVDEFLLRSATGDSFDRQVEASFLTSTDSPRSRLAGGPEGHRFPRPRHWAILHALERQQNWPNQDGHPRLGSSGHFERTPALHRPSTSTRWRDKPAKRFPEGYDKTAPGSNTGAPLADQVAAARFYTTRPPPAGITAGAALIFAGVFSRFHSYAAMLLEPG